MSPNRPPLLSPSPLLPAGVKTGPVFVWEKGGLPPSDSLLDPLQACQGFPRTLLHGCRADVSCHLRGCCAALHLPLLSPAQRAALSLRGQPASMAYGPRGYLDTPGVSAEGNQATASQSSLSDWAESEKGELVRGGLELGIQFWAGTWNKLVGQSL